MTPERMQELRALTEEERDGGGWSNEVVIELLDTIERLDGALDVQRARSRERQRRVDELVAISVGLEMAMEWADRQMEKLQQEVESQKQRADRIAAHTDKHHRGHRAWMAKARALAARVQELEARDPPREASETGEE